MIVTTLPRWGWGGAAVEPGGSDDGMTIIRGGPVKALSLWRCNVHPEGGFGGLLCTGPAVHCNSGGGGPFEPV